MIVVMSRKITITLPEMQRSSAYVKKYNYPILLGAIFVINSYAVFSIYRQSITNFINSFNNPTGHYCTSIDIGGAMLNIIRPKFWYLLVSLILSLILIYVLIRKLQIQLRLNRRNLSKITSIILIATVLLVMFLITKNYCWS